MVDVRRRSGTPKDGASGIGAWNGGLPWRTHKRTPGPLERGATAAAGGTEQVPTNFCLPAGKDHFAALRGPRPGNEVFTLRDKTGTG